MIISDILGLISNLTKKYHSHNPFDIANKKGIVILYGDFGDDVYGFYTKHVRQKFIHLSNRNNDQEQLFACAHELSHAILHPNENTARLSKSSFSSTSKIEAQANCAATLMLIDGRHEIELYKPTNIEVLNFYGLPLEMEKYI